VLEQGLRDRLAVAPLDAAAQGRVQGVAVSRGRPADLGQDPGSVGLGGRLDQTSGDHLLKGPITSSSVPQPQTGVDPVQNVPQQARTLGDHRCAYQAGASRRWFQGLQVQQPLALPGSDPLPPDLQQGRHLGLVVG